MAVHLFFFSSKLYAFSWRAIFISILACSILRFIFSIFLFRFFIFLFRENNDIENEWKNEEWNRTDTTTPLTIKEIKKNDDTKLICDGWKCAHFVFAIDETTLWKRFRCIIKQKNKTKRKPSGKIEACTRPTRMNFMMNFLRQNEKKRKEIVKFHYYFYRWTVCSVDLHKFYPVKTDVGLDHL